MIHVEVREAAFDPWQMLSQWQATQAANTRSGATAVFVGTMRDFNEGDDVTGMFLEHYPGMTEQAIEAMRTLAQGSERDTPIVAGE